MPDKAESFYYGEYLTLIRNKKYLAQPYTGICKRWLTDIINLQVQRAIKKIPSGNLYFYRAKFYCKECKKYVNDFCSYKNGNFYNYLNEQTLKNFSIAIELEPNNPDFYINRIKYYCFVGLNKHHADAMKDYNKLQQLMPNKAEYYRFGIKYLHLYDNYSKLIELDPQNIELYKESAQHRYYTSIDDYTKIIELEPLNIEHYKARAELYKSRKDFVSAITDYTKAIEVEPDNAELKRLRTQCYLDSISNELHNPSPVLIEKLNEFIKADPFGEAKYKRLIIQYRIDKALTMLENKDYESTIEEFTSLINLEPEQIKYYGYRADFYYYRGYTYFLQAKYGKAIEDFTNSIQLGIAHINAGKVYILRGQCYEKLNNLKKAEADYTKAVSKETSRNNTNRSNAYAERARFYRLQNLLDKSLKDIKNSLHLNLKNGEAYYERGLIYQQLNEQTKAREDFKDAFELLPEGSAHKRKCSEMLRKTTPIYTEEYWWQLDGWQFEEEVAKVFKNKGYQTEVTKGSGDGGVDIILKKDGRTSIVQCKHHRHPVPPEPIRALYGCKPDFKADEVILVASSGVTEGGLRFIENKPDFRLYELKDIIDMVKNSDGFDLSDDKIDLATCTKEELLRLSCFDVVKAEKFLNSRKQGKIYYDIDLLATDLKLQPHEMIMIQDKLIFPAKPKSKLGRRVEV